MTRRERVSQILDTVVGGPSVSIAVHGSFQRGLTRAQFVAKKVQVLASVVVGNGAGSILMKALKGDAPFLADLDNPPPDAQLALMPSGLPPVPDTEIAFNVPSRQDTTRNIGYPTFIT